MNYVKFGVIVVLLCVLVGIQSFLPNFKTIAQSGSTSLLPPTGVSASNSDYSNKVGINWDTIRGATSYRVFRNVTNSTSTAISVGTTDANYFFDTSAPINQDVFYWVKAENTTSSSDFSASTQGFRRSGTANGPRPPLEPPTAPVGNAVTAAKIYLGKVLFWEEQLSSTKTVSCGTCHINGIGGSDPNSVIGDLASTNPGPDGLFETGDDITASPGVPSSILDGTYQWNPSFGFNDQVTSRKANSTINSAYPELLFWDGRASNVFRDPITNDVVLGDGAALESQAAGPPTSEVEMAHSGRDWIQTAAQIENSKPLALVPDMPDALESWIDGRTYPELFEEVFGSAQVTPARIAMAIATYERSLFSDRAPVDRLFSGQNTLTPQEQRGLTVFNGANCNACHGGERFTNDLFLYIGVRPNTDDLGRFEVTGQNNNRGSFRVPSLRNVELRAPYMHNGRFQTLEEVVAFYNRGGDFNAPNKAPQIVPQGLSTQQQADLVAFLKRPLTDQRVATETGPFDRPTLYSESNRVPSISGTGRPGTGGLTPLINAISPPIVGNEQFTVSVSNGLVDSAATLVIDSIDPGVGTSIPASGELARTAVTTRNTGSGNGWASVAVPIPNSTTVVGRTFFARWYITDSEALNGFSVSRVAQFTVFGNASEAVPVSISGRVLTPEGLGVRNATVVMTDSSGGVRHVTTSSFGIYTFENVTAAVSYTVSVSSKRYRFAPRVITPSANIADLDFLGLQ